jgi:hypothetical protein
MADRTCLRCSTRISGVTLRRQFCSEACKKAAKRDRERDVQARTGTEEGRTGTPAAPKARPERGSGVWAGARMIPVAWDPDGNVTRWAPSYNPF